MYSNLRGTKFPNEGGYFLENVASPRPCFLLHWSIGLYGCCKLCWWIKRFLHWFYADSMPVWLQTKYFQKLQLSIFICSLDSVHLLHARLVRESIFSFSSTRLSKMSFTFLPEHRGFFSDCGIFPQRILADRVIWICPSQVSSWSAMQEAVRSVLESFCNYDIKSVIARSFK